MDVKELMQLYHQKVGRGRESDIERAMGKAPGYLRKCRYRSSIDLGTFLEALRLAGINPGQFFTEAFGQDFGEDDDDLEPPPAGSTSTVTKGRQRRAAGGGGSVSRAVLEDVDTRLRYDDPRAAVSFIDQHIEDIGADDVPYALGVYASACRPLLRRNAAYEAIWHGLQMVTAVDDLQRKGDLLQRYSHLKASLDGDHPLALRISARAMKTYFQIGDLNGVGKVFVSQGGFYVNVADLDRATACFRAALDLLHPDETRFRFGALQGQGVVCSKRRQAQEACQFFEAAMPLATNTLDVGKLIWMKACVLEDSSLFDQAFETLAPASPVDASLVACDHARAALSAGELLQVAEIIGATRRLLEPLRHQRNPIALAALRDLLCREADGHKLTAAFIADVAHRLRTSLSHQAQPQGRIRRHPGR